MAGPKTIWDRLKASGSLVKGLLLDQVVSKVEVVTPLGPGFLECQLRESGKTGERYLILKTQGGEATVFVPLDKPAAEQLVRFIEQSFLKSPTS